MNPHFLNGQPSQWVDCYLICCCLSALGIPDQGMNLKTGFECLALRWSLKYFAVSSQCQRYLYIRLDFFQKKKPDKIQVLKHLYFVRLCSLQFSLCGDSLSTNFLISEADRYHRFTNRTFYFNHSNCCFWISIKQPFIFTKWTSHMHFLHFSSPPVRGQPKGKVKLTIIFFIILCTFIRDLILM